MSLGTTIDDDGASPIVRARLAGGFYLIVIVGSIYGTLIAPNTGLGHVSSLVASAANLVVTALLYGLLKPVNQPIALLAVLFNVEGSAHDHDPLAFFGWFCLCTAYLVYQSTFLPRAIGVGMALAGLGLLTNAYAPLLVPALPRLVSSVGFAFDGLGEIPLALWLILVGVNGRRWCEVARKAAAYGV